jgi:hypothetical protein
MEIGNKTEDYFSGLFENRPSKIGVIVFSFILDAMNMLLAYGIIWYDRFGLDIKQNLMNRLISSLCWAAIIDVPMIHLIEIPRYFFGPKPVLFCFFQSVIKNAFKWQMLLLLDASILARYVFILWLKNPSAVNDDFWSVFINMWIVGVSLITNGVLFARFVFESMMLIVFSQTKYSGSCLM